MRVRAVSAAGERHRRRVHKRHAGPADCGGGGRRQKRGGHGCERRPHSGNTVARNGEGRLRGPRLLPLCYRGYFFLPFDGVIDVVDVVVVDSVVVDPVVVAGVAAGVSDGWIVIGTVTADGATLGPSCSSPS